MTQNQNTDMTIIDMTHYTDDPLLGINNDLAHVEFLLINTR